MGSVQSSLNLRAIPTTNGPSFKNSSTGLVMESLSMRVRGLRDGTGWWFNSETSTAALGRLGTNGGGEGGACSHGILRSDGAHCRSTYRDHLLSLLHRRLHLLRTRQHHGTLFLFHVCLTGLQVHIRSSNARDDPAITADQVGVCQCIRVLGMHVW